MSDSEDPIDIVDEGGDDLFGDDDGDAVLSELGTAQSDRGGKSDKEGDDAGDRRRDGGEEPQEFREKLVSDVPLYRHRIPKSKDGSLHSLRVPDFIKFNPTEYKADTWTPSRWDLENAKAENPIPSILFRRDPATGRMESNANMIRWSDGSMTLAIGNEHYEIQSKPLAPPANKPYQEVKDAHYYAAAAHLTTNSLLVVGHFTEQFSVRPNKELQDHALEKLKATLASAKKERHSEFIVTKEDPELKKKRAELAEKERMRDQRKRESASARADGTAGRYKAGALSIGDLEGGRRGMGAGAGRKRGVPGGAKKKHRRPEYDSDDELPSGARRPDNYDMDDGFLVDSDEESEEVEDDEEEEELLDDEDERPRAKRQRTADLDADGEADRDTPAHGDSSRRRRHIIDDDDDEE